MSARRVYLDNAATSSPKPPEVWRAMEDYIRRIGASPGRGNYAEAREGGRLIHRCRERICQLIGGEKPEHVIFTLNTSDALNMAIKGVIGHRRLAEPGRPLHVVATGLDHNSVLRPLNAMKDEGVRWTCVEPDAATGLIDPEAIAAAMNGDTCLVAVNHVSNVTGSIQPVEAIGAAIDRVRRARGVDAVYLVDAAQSLGHIDVQVRAMRADLLAFPGHKGLLGPLGTGGLYIRPGVERVLRTYREGGTGSIAELDEQPTQLPEKYEPGSHNAIGIIGLSAGVAWLLERGMGAVRAHELGLISAVLETLAAEGVFEAGSELVLLGPREPERRIGVFSFVHARISPGEIADRLEREHGVLVRPGIHCAPRAHAGLGTLDHAAGRGAVRLSVGPSVERGELIEAVRALVRVASPRGVATASA